MTIHSDSLKNIIEFAAKLWKQQEMWEILEKTKMMQMQNKLPWDFGCDTIKLNAVKKIQQQEYMISCI